MLLERRQDDAGKLFDSYTKAISSRTLPIEDLCQSQILHITLEDYRLAVKASSRNREAAFELALKSTTPFSVGDRVSYYIPLARALPMIAPVLRLTGTHSCAMKTLDIISTT